MYKKVSLTIVMASAIAFLILIVPWATLQRSHAQSDSDIILRIHNDERAAHSIPPLKWSDSLAAEAKTWAEHLATTGATMPSHDPALACCAKGESVAMGGATVYMNKTDVYSSTEELVKSWLDEKNKIDSPVTSPVSKYKAVVGHYVQMVSPATATVGCGIATNTNTEKVFLVCRYDRSLPEPYIPSFLSQPAG